MLKQADKLEQESSPQGDATAAVCASRWRLIFASVFTPSWSSSLLLFVCFFLPLVRGCGSDIVFPFEAYTDIDSVPDFFIIQFYTWCYTFGLLTAAGTLLILTKRNAVHFRTLWRAYAAIIVVVTFGLWAAVNSEIQEASPEESEWMRAEILVFIAPTVLLLAALVLTYFNCRTWFAAALWIQFLLAALATTWFGYLASGGLLWGGRLSLAASVVLMTSTVSERFLGLRMLGVDPARVRRRPQGKPPPPRRVPRWLTILLLTAPWIVALAILPYVVFADV